MTKMNSAQRKMVSTSNNLLDDYVMVSSEGTSGHGRFQIPPSETQSPSSFLGAPNTSSNDSGQSEQAFEELRSAQLENMGKELENKSRDLESAQREVMAVKEEAAKIKIKQNEDLVKQRDELVAKHKEEMEELRKQAANSATELEMLPVLLEELNTANEKVGILGSDKQTLEGKLLAQKSNIERLDQRCQELFNMYADQKTKKISWRDDFETLENKLVDMEEKHELQLMKQKPLVTVGAAIRKRFLEQAKLVLPPRTHYNLNGEEEVEDLGVPDKATIDLGNAAAHFGNSEADAALFTCGFLDEQKKEDYSRQSIS
jgi:hypothetical protein